MANTPNVAPKKIVEAEEELSASEDKFLENLVKSGSDTGEIRESAARYLRNDGQPTIIHADKQRVVYWLDIAGVQRVMRIIIPNRESGSSVLDKDTDVSIEEGKIAEQLRLVEGEKALLYYQPDGSIEKKIVDINFTFDIKNYPHIKDVKFGVGSGINAKIRKYSVLVGQTIKVTNAMDFNGLWKTYGFLNEVDKNGNLVKENPQFSQSKTEQKSNKSFPTQFVEMQAKDIVTPNGGYERTTMDKRNDAESDVIVEEGE